MFPKEVEFYWRRANVFRDRVKEEIYSERVDLQCEYACSQDPVKFPDRLALAYKPLRRGEKWGENWESAWFHITGSVPEHFAGREIALLADFGGEALIFDAEGTPVYGLTNASAFSDRYTKNRCLLDYGRGKGSCGHRSNPSRQREYRDEGRTALRPICAQDAWHIPGRYAQDIAGAIHRRQ